MKYVRAECPSMRLRSGVRADLTAKAALAHFDAGADVHFTHNRDGSWRLCVQGLDTDPLAAQLAAFASTIGPALASPVELQVVHLASGFHAQTRYLYAGPDEHAIRSFQVLRAEHVLDRALQDVNRILGDHARSHPHARQVLVRRARALMRHAGFDGLREQSALADSPALPASSAEADQPSSRQQGA